MLPMRLLLVLCWTSVTTNQAVKQPIPQLMVGEMPASGQPYQIVRIIEYVVPHPYRPQDGQIENTTAADSLEIFAPHLESQFNKNPNTNTANHAEQTLAKTFNIIARASPIVATKFLIKMYAMGSNTPCTGALISYRLVLTSSQCFPPNQTPVPRDYKVQVTQNALYEVSSIILGPSSGLDRYMALMVLKTFVVEPEVQTVALCDAPPRRADTIIMHMSKGSPHFLRTQIISNRACKSSFAKVENAYITESMFCAHNSNKRMDCQTTKGDPLVHRERLCGINIYGPSCVDGATNGDLYVNVFKAKAYLQTMIARYN
ncbi:GL13800 [Drosophila persimilis]|uniref:GL13800 n=1 Tax=Drosophila persimilis TaxID=7234 RepID=B4GP20_DROPE|nr:seminase [Drosophila persimilis]EDW38903.1 GL13800 [Drosophila persimilis]